MLNTIEHSWLRAKVGIPFLFVIDLNEHPLMAKDNFVQYITGRSGALSCDNDFDGYDYQRRFPDQYAFFLENMMNFLNWEQKNPNISHIIPTPNRFNDGYGHIWDDDADMKEVKRIRDAYIDASFMALKKECKDDPIVKFPAFESIAIAFSNRPSDEILAFMKQRAVEYAEKSGYFTVKQCRLLVQTFSEERV